MQAFQCSHFKSVALGVEISGLRLKRAGKQELRLMKKCCSSKIRFRFVSKWDCKLFKIHSVRAMRCEMTGALCWDATCRGVTASLSQAQAGLEPELCVSHADYWLFCSVAALSLTWRLPAISGLTLKMNKQHSEFEGQMRSFSLWLSLKHPPVPGLLAGLLKQIHCCKIPWSCQNGVFSINSWFRSMNIWQLG